MIRSLSLSALLLGIAPIVLLAQAPKATMPPSLPFYQSDPRSPECQRAKWTARDSIRIYDSWNKGHQIAQLAKGDQVTPLTGATVTYKPAVIQVDSDEGSFKRGDRILMYGYYGEGIADAWYKGQFHPKADISFATWPDGSGCSGARCAAKVIHLGIVFHWATIHLPSGKDGWVNMTTAKFDGVCQRAD